MYDFVIYTSVSIYNNILFDRCTHTFTYDKVRKSNHYVHFQSDASRGRHNSRESDGERECVRVCVCVREKGRGDQEEGVVWWWWCSQWDSEDLPLLLSGGLLLLHHCAFCYHIYQVDATLSVFLPALPHSHTLHLITPPERAEDSSPSSPTLSAAIVNTERDQTFTLMLQ